MNAENVNFDDNTLALVASYDNTQTAYIDAGFLESNGIPTKVMVSALSQIFPTPVQPSGQICLYVPVNRLKEAQDLLKQDS